MRRRKKSQKEEKKGKSSRSQTVFQGETIRIYEKRPFDELMGIIDCKGSIRGRKL